MGLGARTGTSRRDVLVGSLCLCCTPALGFAAETAMHEVSPGVFVRRGLDADATAENADAIANIGFVIGRDAVLVTDAGGSLADGRWLRGQIRARTARPIRYVVMTHVHPDHCFGAGAFLEETPEFIGHARLRPALQTRGAFYTTKLSELLGAENIGPVVMPTREVGPDGGDVDLGDRKIELRAHATAHTDCDLSMIDRTAGLLFTADLLFAGRVPALDGSLPGWLRELDTLEALGAETIVPGHGPVAVDKTAYRDMRRYLMTLRDETRAAIKAGLSIEQAVQTVALSERDHWSLFDDYNGRNVTQAFKELEWE
jgi:quinoprotein relay system zinc metallohydrolase 2